jgi:hypothetical protein
MWLPRLVCLTKAVHTDCSTHGLTLAKGRTLMNARYIFKDKRMAPQALPLVLATFGFGMGKNGKWEPFFFASLGTQARHCQEAGWIGEPSKASDEKVGRCFPVRPLL